MNVHHSFSFLWTPTTLFVAVLVVVAAAGLCWVSWKRSGYSRSAGLLELLRFTLVVLIAVTLNQPERIALYKPSAKPTVAILVDNSRSMKTRDAVDTSKPTVPPQTRLQWITPLLNNQNVWANVAQRFNVVTERFASTHGIDGRNGTDIGTALKDALDKHANLRAIVLLSDGDSNQGPPPIDEAVQLRMKNIPVFCVGVGSLTRLPDIEIVSFDAPAFGVVGKTMRIPFALRSSLPQAYSAKISLTSSDGQEVSRTVQIPACGKYEDVFVWKPNETGDFRLTLRVPPHHSEVFQRNNVVTVPVAIRNETLKVLIVEATPRWEYRYLKNAFDRDPGVDVNCLLFHPGLNKVGGGRGYLKSFPDEKDQLAHYDVVFLGDVGTEQLSRRECELLKGLVQQQASGLVFMPGIHGRQLTLLSTPLKDLFPVVFDASQPCGWGAQTPCRYALTESGRSSLLTKLADTEEANNQIWDSLPGFYWYAPVLRAAAGSDTLVVHSTDTNQFGRIPLIVTKTFGNGKVLFMGTDGAWRWRKGVEDKYHYRFWAQVVRWMAYQRNMARGELMRLFFTPDRPRQHAVVTLQANVLDTSGAPLQNGHVTVQITSPSDKTDTVRLTPAGGEWGLFQGTYVPREAGIYQVVVTCRENLSTIETTLSVRGSSREKTGQPARFDILEEIASTTHGKLILPNHMQDVLEAVAALPALEPVVRRQRLWCHPAWIASIFVLMTFFWIGRKATGQI